MNLGFVGEELHLQIQPTDQYQQLKMHNTVLATVVFHE
jgi:hypothetical protein